MKFILTKELGRLSKWLRILGFDTAYFDRENTSSLIIEALRESRIIITRNHKLPKSTGLRVVLIKAEKIKQQMQELSSALNLKLDAAGMFTRCILCNEKLVEAEKEKVKDLVPEYVYRTQERFLTCKKCQRIYWQGTHWGNVEQTLKEIWSL